MDTTSLIRIVSGILVLVLSLLYFYPTFKAMGKRNTGAIFAVNLLTGWCAIGWFVALIWALKNDVVALRPDEVQQYAGRDRRIKVFIYIFWSIVVIFLAVVMILAYAFPASQPKTQQSPVADQSYQQQSSATDQSSPQQSPAAADQSDQQQSPEQSSPIGEATPILSPQPNASPLDLTPRSVQDPVESKRLNTDGLHALSGANPDLANARNDFERSFQLDSTSVEALNNLGYVYGRLGDYQTAESILVKVLDMSPTRKAAQGNLGAVQAELGKTKDAADHFCQYIRHFDSLEQGKSTLSRVFKDADSNVKAAIDLTLANCN